MTGAPGPGPGLALTALVIFVLAIVAVVVALLAMTRWPRRATGDDHEVGGDIRRAAEEPDARSATDPAGVATLINAFDLAGTVEARELLVEQLRVMGVRQLGVRPGDRLDPRLHNVVTSRTSTAEVAGPTVARVERPGWWDSGTQRVIRPADVSVWVGAET